MPYLFLTAGLLFLTSLAPPMLVAQDDSGITMVTSVEGLTEYKLDNGMRVLLFPDPSKPVLTVNNTIFVGSRHEGYGEAGMAHLLEHMLFKGTPDHQDIPKLLKERGAVMNGTTWLDRTNYYETLPASDENLEFAIRLEADRMMNSYVKGEDLKSEMTVVRNEFERGENSPSRVLSQRMMATAYEWHNYGQTTIGNRADIERVPVESLRRFYKKYYQPDNAMVIISGKFEPENALKYVNKYFGAIPKPTRKLEATYTEEPAQDGERVVTLRRVGEVPLVGLMYHIPAGAHPDYASIDVLESIMTSSPSGRLYKSLVETKKSSSVSGVAYSLHDPGVLRFSTQVTKGNAPEVILGIMQDEITKVREEGVTEEEVNRAKQRLLKSFELVMSDSKNLSLQMTEWAAMGDWRLFFIYRDRLEKVTPESVNSVAKKYLERNNSTIGMFIPTKAPARTSIPETPKLAEMIGDYKGREVVAQGEAFDVSPANIEKRTTRGELPSGLKTALLPKKTRGEMVNVRLNLRFGTVESLNGLAKATEFLGPLMIRGTKELDRQQIQDELNKYRARLSLSSSAGLLTVTIQCKKEHLPNVLKIAQQVLRQPTLPETELEILKRGQLTALQQRLPDPIALATNTVSRKINPYEKGDPRYVGTIEEEIAAVEAVTVEDVKKLYNDFLGARDGELVIVGDFEADATLPLVNKMLADWTPQQKYERIARIVDKDAKGGSKVIETPDKENAVYYAGMTMELRDDDPAYPALLIGDFILGGGSLSSRLGNRVRQKEGLSYGVGSNLRASPLDKRGTFSIYAISNPQNIPKVVDVIAEEIDLLLKKGITEEELKNAIVGYLQSQEVSRTNDGTLAQQLATTIITGRTMEFYAKREGEIEHLTTSQVISALREQLDPKKLFIVTAGDFAKAKTEAKPDSEEE